MTAPRTTMLAVSVLVFSAIDSRADGAAGAFLFTYPSHEHRAYLNGMTQGMEWVNSALEHGGREAIFCPPRQVPIAHEQYVEILKSYVGRNKRAESDPMGWVLVRALRDTFPCPPQKPR